uniref:ANK_REP_REGION domain-containing protein n=1 Tax=Macrostomum lignano TaxID=282301 RepID=A0A1I8F564_9PLAT
GKSSSFSCHKSLTSKQEIAAASRLAEPAARNGHLEVRQVSRCHKSTDQAKQRSLLRRGCRTCLARNGHLEVVKFLVSQVADQANRDRCCHRRCRICCKKWSSEWEVVKFIVSQVADKQTEIAAASKLPNLPARFCEWKSSSSRVHKSLTKQTEIAAASRLPNLLQEMKVVKFLVHKCAGQANRDRCCRRALPNLLQMKSSSFSCHKSLTKPNRDRCCVEAAEPAARNGHLEVVKFPVSQVADQANRDRCCIDAAEPSARNGHLEVSSFLCHKIAAASTLPNLLQQMVTQKSSSFSCHKSLTKQTEIAAVSRLPNLLQEMVTLEVVKFIVPQVADQATEIAAASTLPNLLQEIVSGKSSSFSCHKSADQANRDRCCIDAAESAARFFVSGKSSSFSCQKSLTRQTEKQCCIDAAKLLYFMVIGKSSSFLSLTKQTEIAAASKLPNLLQQMVTQKSSSFSCHKSLTSNRDRCCIEAAKSAARNGHLKVVKFLVPQVADQANRDRCCIKAAESAATNGHLKVVKFLSLTKQTEIAAAIKAARICLQQMGHSETRQVSRVPQVADQATEIAAASTLPNLLQDFVSGSRQVFSCHKSLTKQTEIAAASRLPNLLQDIVSGKSSSFSCHKSLTKQTEIAAASKLPNLLQDFWEVVKFLVSQVADQANRDRCCVEAAEPAARNGHLEVVKFLVSQVTDQANRDRCCILAAESAARNGSLRSRQFSSCHKSLTQQTEIAAASKLPNLLLQENGHLKVVKFLRSLLRRGWPTRAARNGHLEVVKFLVPQVADQANRDRCCIDAAESAATNGHSEIVKFLVSQVADQANRDRCCIKAGRIYCKKCVSWEGVKFLRSLLHQSCESAATNGHSELVKFLVPQVADQANRDRCCIDAAESAARFCEWEKSSSFSCHKSLTKQTEIAAASRLMNLLQDYRQRKVVKFLVSQVADQANRDRCCIGRCESAARNRECGSRQVLSCHKSLTKQNRDRCCIDAAESAARNREWEVVKFLKSSSFLCHKSLTKQTEIAAAAEAAETCCKNGHLEVVKFLVPQVADQAKTEIAAASKLPNLLQTNGHLKVVKFLCCHKSLTKQTEIAAASKLPESAATKCVTQNSSSFSCPQSLDQDKTEIACCIDAAESLPKILDRCCVKAENLLPQIIVSGKSFKFLVSQVVNQANRDRCCIDAAESAARNRWWEVVQVLSCHKFADQANRDRCCIGRCRICLQEIRSLLRREAGRTCCKKWSLRKSSSFLCHKSLTKQTEIAAAPRPAEPAAKKWSLRSRQRSLLHQSCLNLLQPQMRHLEVVKFLVSQVRWTKANRRSLLRRGLQNLLQDIVGGKVVKFLVSQVADQANRDRCCVEAAEPAARKWSLRSRQVSRSQVADQANRDRCWSRLPNLLQDIRQAEVVKFLVSQVADQANRDRCCIDAAKSAVEKWSVAKSSSFSCHKSLTKQTEIACCIDLPNLLQEDRCCIDAAKSAVENDQWEVVKFLVHKSLTKQTEIAAASTLPNLLQEVVSGKVVKFLVPEVADQQNREQCCCIDAAKLAVFYGHLESRKFLVSQVADQANRDRAAASKLRICLPTNGHSEVVKFLVSQVADQAEREIAAASKLPNLAAKKRSLLHQSCRICCQHNGHLKVVKFLVPQVADQANRDRCLPSKLPNLLQQMVTQKLVKFLVPQVADQANRDRCCIRRCRICCKLDRCCVKAAEPAARYRQRKVVKFSCHKSLTKQTEIAAASKLPNLLQDFLSLLRRGCRTCLQEMVTRSRQVFSCHKSLTKQTEIAAAILACRICCKNGHLEVVNFLVSQVADPANRNRCCIEAAKSAAKKWSLKSRQVSRAHKSLTKQTEIAAASTLPNLPARSLEWNSSSFTCHKSLTKQTEIAVASRLPNAAAKKWSLRSCVKFLVPQVADQANRDRCCIDAAESAATKWRSLCPASKLPNLLQQNGHLKVVKFLVPQVADQANRDRCCIKAAESAAKQMVTQNSSSFSCHKSLTKQTEIAAAIDAAESAARFCEWEVVKFSRCHKSLTKQTEIAAASRLMNLLPKISVSGKSSKFLVSQVADQANRDRCCIDAAESAAKKSSPNPAANKWSLKKSRQVSRCHKSLTKQTEIAAAIKAAESAANKWSLRTRSSFSCHKSLTKQTEIAAASTLPNLLQDFVSGKSSSFSCHKSLTKQTEIAAAVKADEPAARYRQRKVVKFLVSQVADQANRDRCCIDAAESAAKKS